MTEKELKRFNWGAAYLGFIWSIIHSCFKKWLAHSLLVGIIASIVCYGLWFGLSTSMPQLIILGSIITPFLVYIIVFIYIGFKGNKWAFEAGEYQDIETFFKSQKKWNTVAIILFVLTIGTYLLQFLGLYMLTKSTPGDTKTTVESISVKGCQFLADTLPNIIKTTPLNEEWIEQISDKLEENEKVSYSYGSVYRNEISLMLQDKETYNIEQVTLTVAQNSPCTLSEANCYIFAPTKEPETACRFYFDDSGKVSISKFTQKFLNTK